jgi:RNA polymerase sigma-70 factor (ECF subfamily)
VDDAELLRASVAGDESAFTKLVANYHSSIIRLARYYVGDDQAAQDVAQDTWMAVIRGADKFEGRSSVKTWLLRICANRARSMGARLGREVPVAPANERSAIADRFDAGGLWKDPPAPFTEAVEFRSDSAQLVAAVREAIRSLPEPHATVVTLRDVEGLSNEEVAQLTGLTSGNVRVILHRGRLRVRAAVDGSGREGER